MEVEHVVIRLHPKFIKKLERIRRKDHYESLEEFIIDAISQCYLRNRPG